MHEELLTILRKEVKPALGCTGPTSVSFAVSAAKDAVGGTARSVRLIVDRDTYKNSVSVGIPGTTKKGVVIAAALGAVCGDSQAGLEVLKNVRPGDEAKAEKLAAEHTDLEIKWDYHGVGLYIEAYVETDKGTGHAIVVKTHTNLILQEANGKILFKAAEPDEEKLIDHRQDSIRRYSVEDFYEFSQSVPLEDIRFLQEALDLNYQLVAEGLKQNLGSGFGQAWAQLKGDPVYLKAKMLTAAASDARMAGENLAAMSCASSGNVGITASLPLLAVAQGYAQEGEALLRALALSFLLTIYVKSHIGRLSAMCACAIAASLGVTAGTVLILGGNLAQIDLAIKNVAGSIGGIICDGAKLGCALKLSTAAGVAIEAAHLAIRDVSIPARDGLVGDSADETIAVLGQVATQGMIETDKTVCKLIIERESRS